MPDTTPRPRTPGWTTFDRGDAPLLLAWGIAIGIYAAGRTAWEKLTGRNPHA